MKQQVPWSNSAVNNLRECNRKYLFAQVLATKNRTNALHRKIHELKKMQTLSMWQGSVVDKFMEKVIIPAIQSKKPLEFEILADQAVAMAKKQFEYSRLAIYTDPVEGKKESEIDFCILDIHEIGKSYTEKDIADAYNTIREAVLRIPDIRMPDGQTLIGFLRQCNSLQANVNNWKVEIEQAIVKPQIDLLALYDWKPVVMDWKLSRSYTTDYARQLIICGLVVYLKRLENTAKKPYGYDDIRLFEVNLLKGTVKAHDFTEERVNSMIDEINLTSQDILLLMGNSDNPDIDDFEETDNDGSCKICNYRSICAYLYFNNNHYDEKVYTEFIQANEFA
jgi:hypothetical protein